MRIELGEIEARLTELPQVREAVVLAREDQPGDKRLVAYWTAQGNAMAAGTSHAEAASGSGVMPGEEMMEADASQAEPSVDDLREHLNQTLPGYLVPAAFVRLEAMPLTPNGKVDRKALPAPEGDAFVVQAYEAPQGHTEEVLAKIWQELLGVERVGRHDNFFDLGGHSLLSTQMVMRLQKALGVSVSIRMLFEHPTMKALATAIHEMGGSTERAESIGVAAPLNLSQEVALDTAIQLPEGACLQTLGTAANANNILLTGATGFLGTYLLHELLQRTQATIYCLVRADTTSAGMDRLIGSLQAYGLWDECQRARIEPVCGDMENLGLDCHRRSSIRLPKVWM